MQGIIPPCFAPPIRSLPTRGFDLVVCLIGCRRLRCGPLLLLFFVCFGLSIRNGSIRLIEGNGRSWSKSRAIWCPFLPFPFQSKKESCVLCWQVAKAKGKRNGILITIGHVIDYMVFVSCMIYLYYLIYSFFVFGSDVTLFRTSGSYAEPTAGPSISCHHQDPVPNGLETCPSTKDVKLIR